MLRTLLEQRELVTGIYIVSTSQMLNLFAATGYVNYANGARMYLQMMLELTVKYSELYEKFSTDRYHTARMSDRFWGDLGTDLTIAQCMTCSIKRRYGLEVGEWPI